MRDLAVGPDNLLVVGIGGDVGVYAFFRSFHERYGANAIDLEMIPTRVMQDSAFVKSIAVPDIDDDEALLAALEQVAERYSDRKLVLFTNSDWHVRTVVAYRDRLERAGYLMRYPCQEVIDQVATKEGFARICAELGIATPRTRPVYVPDLADGGAAALDGALVEIAELGFPVIAKPSDSSQWFEVTFPGKLKVHTLTDVEQVRLLLGNLVRAQYPGTLLVQEFVPGDETQQRSLTAYRDAAGEVTLLATGRVLLEEHTPGTLGIPAAILVEPYPEAMASARRFLDHVGYVGFANFDLKRDPRTGADVFFEVNPRIGRNNYYVTAGGVNTAEVLVTDLVDGARAPLRTADREVVYSVVPYGLLRRYLLDAGLRDRLRRLRRTGGFVNPLYYRADARWRRRLIVTAITQNYRRKFAKHYPKPK